jgi:hypothetical protein
MPRVYDSTSSPIDFCQDCFPDEKDAWKQYGNVGFGPDRRGNCYGYDTCHPAYEDTDYTCHTCGAPLGRKDDYKEKEK